jgi:hypothetical protein
MISCMFYVSAADCHLPGGAKAPPDDIFSLPDGHDL